MKKKYLSFNWLVWEINGHDFSQILSTIKEAQRLAKKKKKPACIIAHTIPGKGVSFMENDYRWHGKAPGKEETKRALAELKEERKKLLKL